MLLDLRREQSLAMKLGLIVNAVTGVLFVVDLAASIPAVVSSGDKGNGEAVCSTPGCVGTAERISENINPEINPCDNFYDFACGGYVASTPVPEGEISVDPFSQLEEEIANQMRTLVEEPISPDESKPFKLAKTLYRTCMDTSALEEAGLEPLRKILRQFGNWPVVEGNNWKEQDFDWVESVYASQRLGYSADIFFTLTINIDWSNTRKYMLVLDQTHFGLSREFLIEGAEYFAVKAYYDYMVDIAVLLGANKQRAVQELKESLEFEIKLANITLADEERLNFTLLHNPMTVSELGKKYPFVNWEEYINNLLPSTVRVDANEIVSVRETNFITELGKLLRNTPKRVQANYVVWRAVADSVKHLTKDMRERAAEYASASTKRNIKKDSDPRWKECLEIISKSLLSLSTSALYVRKYFEEDARWNVIKMVNDIKKELIKNVEKADWMDKETRRKAMEKAEAMLTLVAYPVELLDDKELEKFYTNVTLSPNDFLGNLLNLEHVEMKLFYEFLRKPVNKSDWITHDFTTEVNAFYDPTENSVQIPAAVLQGTFYSDNRPRYMNYGAIGFSIGHEMSHSFDNEGRQFDKDGNLVDWWTPETTEKYARKAQCIIDQYSNYTVESVDENVDGANTLAENIADNGGIRTAYLAYEEYVKRNGPEPKLPGLDYTPKQMFWISAANMWCAKYLPESVQYELTTDVHSPGRFRVIGPFSNMPEFAADFDCPSGSYMNPVKKCSLF